MQIPIKIFLRNPTKIDSIRNDQFFKAELMTLLFQQIDLISGCEIQEFSHIFFGQINVAGVAKSDKSSNGFTIYIF